MNALGEPRGQPARLALCAYQPGLWPLSLAGASAGAAGTSAARALARASRASRFSLFSRRFSARISTRSSSDWLHMPRLTGSRGLMLTWFQCVRLRTESIVALEIGRAHV